MRKSYNYEVIFKKIQKVVRNSLHRIRIEIFGWIRIRNEYGSKTLIFKRTQSRNSPLPQFFFLAQPARYCTHESVFHHYRYRFWSFLQIK